MTLRVPTASTQDRVRDSVSVLEELTLAARNIHDVHLGSPLNDLSFAGNDHVHVSRTEERPLDLEPGLVALAAHQNLKGPFQAVQDHKIEVSGSRGHKSETDEAPCLAAINDGAEMIVMLTKILRRNASASLE